MKKSADPAAAGGLSDQVYEKLKKAILGRDLPPGSRISERDLTKKLQTSNTTVKRALHKLSIEGLVEIKPRSGTFVSGFGEVNTGEITKIRAALEGLAAGFAAVKASPDEIGEMEKLLESMAAGAAAGNSRAAAAANEAFHGTIHAAARNPYIVRLIGAMRSFETGFRMLTLTSRGDLEKSLAGHRSVYEAIRRGNAGLAEKRMRGHVLETLKSYQDAAAPNPPPEKS